MSVVELAIFTPKFKFLVSIALNHGFFRVKALKIFWILGQVGFRSFLKDFNFLGQGLESQGLESLEPELPIHGNLEKARSAYWF